MTILQEHQLFIGNHSSTRSVVVTTVRCVLLQHKPSLLRQLLAAKNSSKNKTNYFIRYEDDNRSKNMNVATRRAVGGHCLKVLLVYTRT